MSKDEGEEEEEVDDKEARKAELVSYCLKTLKDNCSSFVCMLQAGPEYMAECHWDGNVEACASMVQRAEEEFRISVYGPDEIIVIGGDEDGDDDGEWVEDE